MPNNKTKQTAMLTSLIVGTLIFGLKIIAAKLSGSIAIWSDALESIVNILAAAFGLFAVHLASQPADDNHPYGHGKIEHFAAIFEGGLILFAAVLILIQGVDRLLHPIELDNVSLSLILATVSGALNAVLGLWLIHNGKKTSSPTLQADGRHLMTDVATSIALIVGVGLGVLFNLKYADPLLAVLVSIWMMRTGWNVLSESIHPLMDAEDPGFLKEIATVLNTANAGNTGLPPECIDLHETKSRRLGSARTLEWHLVVPEYMSVHEAHNLVESLESKIQAAVLNDAVLKDVAPSELAADQIGSTATATANELHIITHTDPCFKRYCSHCLVESCPIRSSPPTISTAPTHTLQSLTRSPV